MNENEAVVKEEVKVVVLSQTFEAFGMVMDLLSYSETFRDFTVADLAPVVQRQLKEGFNLGAVSDGQLIGYAGWLLTDIQTGNDWVENKSFLRPIPTDEADAAALTIFVSEEKNVTRRLIRGARELNKGKRVFFKRGYNESLKHGRKSAVLNVNGET